MRDKSEEAIRLSPAEARAILRKGGWTDLTEGFAQASIHASLMVVPQEYVGSIRAFAAANPRAVPIIDVLPSGAFSTPLADGGDLRTDVARYERWEYGEKTGDFERIDDLWNDGLVALLIGTTHILGMALKDAGIPAETVDNPRPAIYKTALNARIAGQLASPTHVTVKFARPEEVETIIAVSSEFPLGHGAPLSVGGELVGVEGDEPVFGHTLQVPENRVPVFWECSFTLIAALRNAKVPLFLCSAAGCTFILDVPWSRARNTTNIA